MILVVDFGGQYNQLIARRIRDLNIYCEVVPYNKALKELENRNNVEGIIFTGGPNSVYEESAPKIEKEIFELNIPILECATECNLSPKILVELLKKQKIVNLAKQTPKSQTEALF